MGHDIKGNPVEKKKNLYKYKWRINYVIYYVIFKNIILILNSTMWGIYIILAKAVRDNL